MKGIWVWPEDEKEQKKVIKKVAESAPILTVLTLLSKSKDGLSNAQIDTMMTSNSQWNTLWTLRQLLSLRFANYKLDLFGDPGKYQLTDLGKDILAKMTG